jgi:Fur family transcriptional regulator, ferric uptake regulator
MKSQSQLQTMLREKGFKSTAPRLAILACLVDSMHYARAQDIHKVLKKKNIDLVTIYRTLASFEKAGLVRRVDVKKDAVYYELALHHHHHIICTKCDKVSEFENIEDARFITQALKQTKDFVSVSYHAFDLFGLCKVCAQK